MKKIDANVFFGFWPKGKVASDIDTVLSRMKKNGIDKALVCSTRGWFYDHSQGNDETLDIVKQHKDKLWPVATINPNQYFGLSEEVDRIVENDIRLVRFFPVEQEWSINQRHFQKLLKKLSDTDLSLMIPSTESITSIGNIAAGISNKIIIETVRAYPSLAELFVVAQENPNIYIETHLIGSTDFVEVLVKEVGQDRIIFGSGSPLHSISSATLPIINSAIDQSVKESIFSKNIIKVLNYESD